MSCTGGGAGLEKDAGNADYFDPGSVPHNLYDRGFVENWKEVLFPLSRRKEAVDMGGYSRPMRATPKADEPKTALLSIASSLSKAD